MLVSHAYRFIFIKPRKTAGTSVELALSPILAAGDMATPIEPEEEPLRQVADGVQVGLIRENGARLRDHSPLAMLWKALPETRTYRVATMTRNPWDRAVSQFFWSHRKTDMRTRPADTQRAAFNVWTRKWGPRTWLDPLLGRKRQRALDASQLYWVNGACRAHFAVRFEYLAEDLLHLGDWLDLPRTPCMSDVAKSGIRPKQAGWISLFDGPTRDLVARECANEIAIFGYDFEGNAPLRGPEISLPPAIP